MPMTVTAAARDTVALPDLAAIRAAHARIAPLRAAHAGAHLRGARRRWSARGSSSSARTSRRSARSRRAARATRCSRWPDEAAARGVVTHSSGNHGAALAYAAQQRRHSGVRRDAGERGEGQAGERRAVRREDPLLRADAGGARGRRAPRSQRETGATLVHPYDDVRVIAGQGTAALELLEAVPDLDVVIAPVGGGGLLSGTAIAATAIEAGHRVFGAEPAGADDAARGFASGKVEPLPHPETIADGLRATLSARTLGAIRAPRRRDRHLRARTAIVARDAHDVGADEDRHRAVVRGAARVPARRHARRSRASASASSSPAATSTSTACPGSERTRHATRRPGATDP